MKYLSHIYNKYALMFNTTPLFKVYLTTPMYNLHLQLVATGQVRLVR